MKKMKDNFGRIPHGDEELVACDHASCKEFGEYTTCYLDPIFKTCDKYMAYQAMLKRRSNKNESTE